MTNRARGERIEREARRSSVEDDIPVPEVGGWIPPKAYSTPTQAAGRPSRRADRRADELDTSGEKPAPEGAGRRPTERSPAARRKSAGRSNKSSAGATWILGGANRFLAGAMTFRAEHSGSLAEQQRFRLSSHLLGRAPGFLEPSNQIYDRATTFTRERRLAACARSNPGRLSRWMRDCP
jgi:hypothetical protein